jgi:hypothetical protein
MHPTKYSRYFDHDPRDLRAMSNAKRKAEINKLRRRAGGY